MSEFAQVLRAAAEGQLDGVSDFIVISMFFVLVLLAIASIVALVIAIWLAIRYVKYNRMKNSTGRTGEEVARKILDDNGLQNIRVSKNGSILFGNSYSHYFKKVRLRRLTWKKDTVTSLAMAAQKSSLAIMDKEGNPDMKKRIALTPIIYLGPLAFIPLIIIGMLLDIFILKTGSGSCTIILTACGLALYVISFVMSILVLKTEKVAQEKALVILKQDGLATDDEIQSCKELFKLYNIEYVNDMVISLLELIYRVLQIIAYVQRNSN